VFACVLGLSLVVITGSADALIIRDQCNQTSGDGQGNTCPPGDYVLVRPKDTNGKCHDWICCPANGDGTYNCEQGVPPTKSAISSALKGLLGPRATVLSPSTTPGTRFQQVVPSTKVPFRSRGVEGDKAGEAGSSTGKSDEATSR
jgi:hypothetical protein